MYEAVYVCIILFLADRKFKASAFSLPHMEILSDFEGVTLLPCLFEGWTLFYQKAEGTEIIEPLPQMFL